MRAPERAAFGEWRAAKPPAGMAPDPGPGVVGTGRAPIEIGEPGGVELVPDVELH